MNIAEEESFGLQIEEVKMTKSDKKEKKNEMIRKKARQTRNEKKAEVVKTQSYNKINSDPKKETRQTPR